MDAGGELSLLLLVMKYSTMHVDCFNNHLLLLFSTQKMIFEDQGKNLGEKLV